MKVSTLMAALVTALCIGSGAQAGDASDAKSALQSVSRAEVLADLQIWREAGVVLEDGEASAAHTPAHDAALARYQAMRASPMFAALVQRIAQRRGEKLIMASEK